ISSLDIPRGDQRSSSSGSMGKSALRISLPLIITGYIVSDSARIRESVARRNYLFGDTTCVIRCAHWRYPVPIISFNEKLRDWNSCAIKPPSLHEDRKHHFPHPSRAYFYRVWFQRVFAFPSHAAAAGRSGRRLSAGVCCQRLHLRYRGDANTRRVALAHRAFRPAWPDDSRRNHLQHIGFPRPHGAGRFRARPRPHSAGALSYLALSRCFRWSGARVKFSGVSFMVAAVPSQAYAPSMDTSTATATEQTKMKRADVIVRGNPSGFLQEVVSGKHNLRADEPVSAGGSDAAPGPYDYLLVALGVCPSMTVGLYARRKQWPLENITVSLRHSRIHAKDCEECDTKEGML